MSPVDQANAAIDALLEAAERVAQACRVEMELEDERSILKSEAVRRIMVRDNLAATPAEKIVETDEQYAAHRRRQHESVVEKARAYGQLDAARLRATLTVALATKHAA